MLSVVTAFVLNFVTWVPLIIVCGFSSARPWRMIMTFGRNRTIDEMKMPIFRPSDRITTRATGFDPTRNCTGIMTVAYAAMNRIAIEICDDSLKSEGAVRTFH